MSDVISPASADQALEMLTAAMGYLAAADATAMTAEEQARCLKVLERATAIGAAARTSMLSAFTSGQGYSADAQYSAKAWLVYKTGVTKGTAASHTAWMRRAREHGGETSTTDCVLMCRFHHLIVIHQWGWTLVLNPDGTTTAWNKDKTKVLPSHGPPVRPG